MQVFISFEQMYAFFCAYANCKFYHKNDQHWVKVTANSHLEVAAFLLLHCRLSFTLYQVLMCDGYAQIQEKSSYLIHFHSLKNETVVCPICVLLIFFLISFSSACRFRKGLMGKINSKIPCKYLVILIARKSKEILEGQTKSTSNIF